MRRRLFLALFGALLPLAVMSYDVKIDGLYYNLVQKAKVAEVTYGDDQYAGDIVIPSSFAFEGVEYSVLTIGEEAFKNNREITSIKIPPTITQIKNSAFSGVEQGGKFKKVIISDISAWCNIQFTDFANNPLYIAHHLFLDNNEIIHLSIPVTVKSISNNAFAGGANFSSVDIPNSITDIGSRAFLGCTGLKKLNIPSSITSIQDEVFSGCTGLTDLVIPNSVKTIGLGAFSACSSLKELNLPNSVEIISNGAFQRCSGLTSLVIPSSVKSLGWYSFGQCSGLKSIEFSTSLTTIPELLFAGCTGLEKVTIPASVSIIDKSAFSDCTMLKTVIWLRKGQSYIGKNSFGNCSELADFYCYAEEIPLDITYKAVGFDGAFSDSYVEYATLHVPEKSLSEYKATLPWSGFGKIVPLDESEEPVEADNPDNPIVPDEPSNPDNPLTPDEPSADPQEVFLEYFIDKDPGYGKANKVKDISAGNNELEFELSSINPGAHMLYVRTKDEQGRWSATISRPLYVRQPVSIVALEYFFDDKDPGQGKGVQVVPPMDTSKPYEFEVSLGNLPVGEHRLNVRAKGSDGIWTALSSGQFTLLENTGIHEPSIYREPSVVYTLKGYKGKDEKGVNIVRRNDGTTKKVIIK